jgi:hypothetical protein
VLHRQVSLRSGIAALATLASVIVVALPASGSAAPSQDPASAARDAGPWATVNVCDTVGHPDGIGIRGSMPGTGDRRDELFMRIQVQYRRGDGRWARIGRAADSGYLDLGDGDVRARQAGRTYTFMPPPAGQPAFVLRGLVTFVWRRDGAVVRRVRRLTGAGHPNTAGADPADFSEATCSIR